MTQADDKRKIDDPELNQDSTYDKKAEEDFDNSDDFHKYDHTDDVQSKEIEDERQTLDRSIGLNDETDTLNTEGQFDGNINI